MSLPELLARTVEAQFDVASSGLDANGIKQKCMQAVKEVAEQGIDDAVAQALAKLISQGRLTATIQGVAGQYPIVATIQIAAT